MHLTADQARRLATLFPRHPLVWVSAAFLVALILVRRPAPDPSSAGVQIFPTSAPADPATLRAGRAAQYAWLTRRGRTAYQPLTDRIAPPAGYHRIPLTEGSFGDWLRHLPCLPESAPILDSRGKAARTPDDPAIAAVIDLVPTHRGLLAAANMAIRLRAEYAWTTHRMDELHLSFTSGEACPWPRFVAGERPTVQGRTVTWHTPRNPDRTDRSNPNAAANASQNHGTGEAAATDGAGRGTFTAYLESLFPFTGIISLNHDTVPVTQGHPEPGDVFVLMTRNGGHAVIVLDAVEPGIANENQSRSAGDPAPTGPRLVLLGEGFTPAQSFHVLRQSDGSPWFKLDRAVPIAIPTWPTLLPWRTWRRWP